eukprot:SAG22_NODE_6_length_41368_cov_49.702222_4_plen_209_part_00
MGTVVLMGWRLGIMESTNVAILIGISVDFVVHFAHAFVHPPTAELHGTRERVRHSLTTMGISVAAAATTTFLSALVLSMCTLTFFTKFGVFLSVRYMHVLQRARESRVLLLPATVLSCVVSPSLRWLSFLGVRSMTALTIEDCWCLLLQVTMVASTLLSVGFFQALLAQFGPPGRDEMATRQLLAAEVAVGTVGLLLLFVVFSCSFDE